MAGLSEIKVSEEPPLMSKDVAWVGLGIASGPTPGGGTPRYIILYAVAEKAAKSP